MHIFLPFNNTSQRSQVTTRTFLLLNIMVLLVLLNIKCMCTNANRYIQNVYHYNEINKNKRRYVKRSEACLV